MINILMGGRAPTLGGYSTSAQAVFFGLWPRAPSGGTLKCDFIAPLTGFELSHPPVLSGDALRGGDYSLFFCAPHDPGCCASWPPCVPGPTTLLGACAPSLPAGCPGLSLPEASPLALRGRRQAPCARPPDPARPRARQACAERIQKDTTGEAHCTGQFFDYWSAPRRAPALGAALAGCCRVCSEPACARRTRRDCIDKCAAPKLFAKLR